MLRSAEVRSQRLASISESRSEGVADPGPSTKPSSEKSEKDGGAQYVDVGEATRRADSIEAEDRAWDSSWAVNAVTDGLLGTEVTELKRPSRRERG